MNIHAHLAEQSDQDCWDRIVQSSPQGSIFHQWKWLQITSEECNALFYPLIFYNKDTPLGLLPLFLQKKGGLQFVTSPPLHSAIPYMGIILNEFDLFKQHKKEHFYQEIHLCADLYIEKNFHPSYRSVDLTPQLTDPRPYRWSGYEIQPRYDYTVDTTQGVRSVCENLDRKLRMDIKRGISRGIEINQGRKPELIGIYQLMVQRYREQNMSVLVPLSYLTHLYDNFPDNFKIFCAYYKGDIVSGYINLQWKDEIFLWIGNPKSSLPITPSPNDVCGWSGLKYACEHNLKKFVFIGAAGNERIHSYYAKYNPELRLRFSVKKLSGLAKVLQFSYVNFYKPLAGKLQGFTNSSGLMTNDI
jgi:hypothetical protein